MVCYGVGYGVGCGVEYGVGYGVGYGVRQSIPPTNYLVPPTNYLFLGNPRGEVFHSQTKVGPHTD
jgi:hypothetical protein